MRIPRPGGAMLIAVSMALLLPASAPAAVPVGSGLPEPDGALECGEPGGCTFVPTTILGSPVAVPFDGVIVRWAARFPAGETSTSAVMRVLRRAAGGQLADLGRSISPTPAANGSVVEWSSRMPVRAGDLIGVDLGQGTRIGLAAHETFDWGYSLFVPRLGRGETRAPTDTGADQFEPLFNARVEPDADGDGYGDETQDECPALAERHSTCRGFLSVSLAGPGPAWSRDPFTIIAGGELTTRALVRSDPLHRTPDVVLTIAVPPELSLVSVGGPCASEPGRVVCRLGSMARGSQVGVNLRLRALRPATGSDYSNQLPAVWIRASVTGGLPGPAAREASTSVRILARGRCANGFVGNPVTGGTVAGTLAGAACRADRSATGSSAAPGTTAWSEATAPTPSSRGTGTTGSTAGEDATPCTAGEDATPCAAGRAPTGWPAAQGATA